MELNSKQRAQLRGLANGMEAIVHIGKDGLGENLIQQANDALEARELIKCKALENSEFSAREAADALARVTRAEVVQVIGTKFVLYRPSHNKEKRDRIDLVRDNKPKAKVVISRNAKAVPETKTVISRNTKAKPDSKATPNSKPKTVLAHRAKTAAKSAPARYAREAAKSAPSRSTKGKPTV